jgi:hypothetical protein
VHAIPESNTKYKKILVIAQQPNQPDLFPWWIAASNYASRLEEAE